MAETRVVIADRTRLDRRALLAALVVFAFHAAFASRYDLFRDELYFIVCGQHPAFGYVDQPPLVPLLAAGLYAIGHGAFALRLPGAIVSGALVYLAARFVVLLGGGRLAAAPAMLAVAIAPMLMGLTAVLNTTLFDPLLWTAVAYLLARAIRFDDDRALIGAGMVVGLALEIKYAMLFWAVGLAIGILVTPQRRLVLRPALWIGLALGVLIALPSFVWQAAHHFPFLELGAAAKDKNADVALGPFLANQAMVMNPASAPLWIAGLVGPFVVARLKDMRFVPIACLVVLVIVRLGHGKDYYMAPCYPVLFVLGAVTLAPLVTTVARKLVAGLVAVAAIAVSAVIAPITLPLLSPFGLAHYMTRIGFTPQAQERSFAGTSLPQVFADQLGWHDFTRQVVDAWARIPPADKARTAIKLDNYGETAALDIFGRPAGLPPSLSGHNQYYLWGLRGQDPVNLLVVQRDVEALRPYCSSVEVLATTSSRFAMAYENGKAIALCRGLKQPLATLWPQIKHFD
ncbi:glycosyltransferase family 39 protein [Novosphingobium sp.]|uniref:ArnT family glycosyltransferase n=1 Tax=Novosphingobium sp. TaxID=1874826 RepID=UPI0025E74697|nr:glycosyltransferase family 39 protein [Novosphingobium sp.]